MKIYSIFLLVVISFMLFDSTPIIAQSKQTTKISIEERLSKYFPVFEDPSCLTYLIEFGSDDKAIKIASKDIGIQFLYKAPLPQLDDGYIFIYTDPQNISTKNGKEVTHNVLYIFSFTPSGDYFSFGSNFTFKTSKLAKEAYDYLLSISGGSEYESGDMFTTVITCDDRNSPHKDKSRLLRLKRDGNSVTFILIDYDLLGEYMKRVGS